jgi:GTP-binding protein
VLGIVGHGSAESFVMADLPGLIEGAHEGRGLGHRFLRHVERTRVLVILLDSSSATLESDYVTLVKELSSYGQGLSEKPRLVALNKIDLFPEGEVPSAAFSGEEVYRVSGMTGDGLPELTRALVAILSELDD